MFSLDYDPLASPENLTRACDAAYDWLKEYHPHRVLRLSSGEYHDEGSESCGCAIGVLLCALNQGQRFATFPPTFFNAAVSAFERGFDDGFEGDPKLGSEDAYRLAGDALGRRWRAREDERRRQ
jgi:hypothetical protein